MPNFTKQAIKASFLKLLNEQPLNKISVRSIVEDCGINRNSFYYHFQDIPALLEEIVKEEIDSLILKNPTINSADECVNLAFRFAFENKKAVMHIYESVNRDIYEQYSMKLCEYVAKTYIDTIFGKETVSENNRKIAIRFLKCFLFGLKFEWIQNGMRDDAVNEAVRITELCRRMEDELISGSHETSEK
ncbi:MAG: TetR/AcrR family transcriptional regulator C-terminal domain-containing protein [Firmicutes bacterium]|nr:TetR/AcrR family transcriptional regulator C-terminal domain-containing protein [Bacillota bacterium]